MNIKLQTQVYRPTVSGLFFCQDTLDTLSIGIHWQGDVALVEESYLSPVAADWQCGESAEAAIRRKIELEFSNIGDINVTPLEHAPFELITNFVRYYWLLVELGKYPSKIRQPIVPDVDTKKATSFEWYSPGTLEKGISLMHPKKQQWFRRVLKISVAIEPKLRPFTRRFG